jgi:hypothetical protein
MRHTVKAVFDHRSDAQHVLDELLASGYVRADTTLSSAPPAGQADTAPEAASGEHTEGLGTSVRHTLARLFSPRQHKQTMADSDADMHGRHVVTLTTDSEPDTERAVSIMKRFSPAGIEDLPEELGQGTVVTGPGGAGTGAGGRSRVYPPGTEPGALQKRAHEDRHYFGTQNAESPPTGNTFEETMGAEPLWRGPDAVAPRARAPAPLADSDSGSPDADMAAYRYGKEMRASEKYRNRSWDEVEASLKGGWEARDTRASAWDESKAAIRSGWDSTSPDIVDERL